MKSHACNRLAVGLIAALTVAPPPGLRAQGASSVTRDSAVATPAPPPPPLPPCLGCGSAKHFGRAATEVVIAEMIPYTMDRWVNHQPWAQTTLQSWGDNLKQGWTWDNDHFVANQFSHPYSGSLYFNAARSNGYSFWSAAPFSLVGSALWEYFGETQRPSTNDVANTTLGGITFGETMYRLSGMILDNRSTGAERAFREIGGFLVDPIRGFSRLLNGDMGRVGPNPVDRFPSRLHGSLDLGYQRVDQGPRGSAVRGPAQAFTFLTLGYGDPLAGDVTHPFGAMRLEVSLATPGAGMFSQVRAGGMLAVRDLNKDDRNRQQLGLAMHYHYYNNRAFESGGQGFSGIWTSRRSIGAHNSLRTEVWLTGFVLAAIKSDYSADSAALATEKARNYDYGPGGGGRVLARFEHGDRWFVDLAYQGFWIDVLSGTADYHLYHTASSLLQIRVRGHLAVGERDFVYFRTSHYSTHPTTHTRDYQVQGFLAWVF